MALSRRGLFFPISRCTCSFVRSLVPISPVQSITVTTGAMFASFVVSFTSVGWWSELGDRKGRKIPLFYSILGALLMCVATSTHDPNINRPQGPDLPHRCVYTLAARGRERQSFPGADNRGASRRVRHVQRCRARVCLRNLLHSPSRSISCRYAFDVAPTPLSRYFSHIRSHGCVVFISWSAAPYFSVPSTRSLSLDSSSAP